MTDEVQIGCFWTTIVLLILGFVASLFWFFPCWNVWASRLEGRAHLAEAQSSRQIAVQEAQAKLNSASLLAQAEVERAKGVAQANQIIGNSLKGNEAYLRYLWITGLESGTGKETVYIPTEAGLPILEAGRMRRPAAGTAP